MSYRADKLGVDAHTRALTQTDAGNDNTNDNTRRPKLASGKNLHELNDADKFILLLSSKDKQFLVWTG